MLEIEPRVAKELRAKYDRILATTLPQRLASFNPAADHRRPRRRRRGLNLLAAVAVVAVVVAILAVPIVLGIQSRHETPAVPPQPTPKVTPGPPLHHNGQIVIADRDGLIAFDLATGDLHVILNAPAGGAVDSPAYSPDGRNIAYLRGGANAAGSETFDSIWVLDTRTGHTRQLTTCPGCASDSISWSPDGSRLAFSDVDPRGNLQLHLIDADGTHGTQLTHFPGFENAFHENAYQPTWSPDGTRIAFIFFGDVPTQGAYPTVNIDVIRPDGTGLGVLLADPTQGKAGEGWATHIYPAWSPDGSRIAYILDPQDPSGVEGQVEVWLMDPDGSHRTQVFLNDGCCRGALSFEGPAWSPDGTRIAVVVGHTLWLVNADGSAPTSRGQPGGGRPAWQPVR